MKNKKKKSKSKNKKEEQEQEQEQDQERTRTRTRKEEADEYSAMEQPPRKLPVVERANRCRGKDRWKIL